MAPFVELPKVDTLFCIYSVVEASMLNYLGRLAILKNKQKPEVEFCSSNGIYFRPVAFADNEENLLFLVAHIYNESTTELKEPFIILDIIKGAFAYFTAKGIGGFHKVVKKSKGVYEMRHDEFTIMRQVSKTPLIKQIHIGDIKWYPLDMLNELKQIIFNT